MSDLERPIPERLREVADESARRWAARIGLEGAWQQSRTERLMRDAADRIEELEAEVASLAAGRDAPDVRWWRRAEAELDVGDRP